MQQNILLHSSMITRVSKVVQGQPLGFDTENLALADRNMQVRFSCLGIRSSGNLIWLKVTSLSSIASKIKGVKTSNSKFLTIHPTLKDQHIEVRPQTP